jgi:hypothetical protein
LAGNENGGKIKLLAGNENGGKIKLLAGNENGGKTKFLMAGEFKTVKIKKAKNIHDNSFGHVDRCSN